MGSQEQADTIYKFVRLGNVSLQDLQIFLVSEGLQPKDYEDPPEGTAECMEGSITGFPKLRQKTCRGTRSGQPEQAV